MKLVREMKWKISVGTNFFQGKMIKFLYFFFLSNFVDQFKKYSLLLDNEIQSKKNSGVPLKNVKKKKKKKKLFIYL